MVLTANSTAVSRVSRTIHAVRTAKGGSLMLVRYVAGCPSGVRDTGIGILGACRSTFSILANCSSRTPKRIITLTSMIVNNHIVRGRFALGGASGKPSRPRSVRPRRFEFVISSVHRMRHTVKDAHGRMITRRKRAMCIRHHYLCTGRSLGGKRVVASRSVSVLHPTLNVPPGFGPVVVKGRYGRSVMGNRPLF